MDAPAESVRHSADLLGDEDLLEHREPAAAEVRRHVHRGEAELPRLRDVSLVDLARDPAVVLLGVDLPGDQLVVDEASCALLDLPIVLGEARLGHGR
jgi:glycosyltransferase A (GT-A) superfamily protein (DUF2064 family)